MEARSVFLKGSHKAVDGRSPGSFQLGELLIPLEELSAKELGSSEIGGPYLGPVQVCQRQGL